MAIFHRQHIRIGLVARISRSQYRSLEDQYEVPGRPGFNSPIRNNNHLFSDSFDVLELASVFS
ncbi:hypothetical protein Slin14017_G122590 [Septoria linicola]|nr:hypothetical protein Slin14017_G122590 [Septoria linicola]